MINLYNAKYIFRIDDIHSEMNWDNFYRAKNIFDKYNVKPLIAVIPQNLDDSLKKGIDNKNFYQEIIKLMDNGWDIAMHGFEHRYMTNSSGIVKINNFSEFSGLPIFIQRQKIHDGKIILSEKGINTDIFIAPAHSFDKYTCKVLTDEGFRVVSDGISFWPFSKYNQIWIPQIAWKPKRFLFGIITFCLHLNTFSELDFQKLDLFLSKNNINILNIKSVLVNYNTRHEKDFFVKTFNNITDFILKMIFYTKLLILKVLQGKKHSPFINYMDSDLKYTDPKLYEERIFRTPAERYSYDVWFNFLTNQIKERTIGKVVADLGCGTGSYTKYCEKANKIYAVDLSEQMVLYAKNNLKNNINIVFLTESSVDTSIKNNTVDVVIIFGLLDYVNIDAQFLEISRILKKDGKVLVLVPNKYNFLNFLVYLKHLVRREKSKNFLTYLKCKKIFQRYGFAIDLMKSKGNVCYTPLFLGDSVIYIYKFLEWILKPFQKVFPVGINLYFCITKEKD